MGFSTSLSALLKNPQVTKGAKGPRARRLVVSHLSFGMKSVGHRFSMLRVVLSHWVDSFLLLWLKKKHFGYWEQPAGEKLHQYKFQILYMIFHKTTVQIQSFYSRPTQHSHIYSTVSCNSVRLCSQESGPIALGQFSTQQEKATAPPAPSPQLPKQHLTRCKYRSLDLSNIFLIS